MTHILLVVDNVHMGLGHDGLKKIATKMRLQIERLGPGEVILFLNRRKDKLKMLGANGRVIGYLKMPQGERMDLNAIQFIPQAFRADGSIDYETALKKAVETVLLRRNNQGEAIKQIYRH